MTSFFVAYAGGQFIGCCALQIYSKRMAEVRSLNRPANLRSNRAIPLEGAQAGGRGVNRWGNSADLAAPGESVLREFLRSEDSLDRLPTVNKRAALGNL